jgi:hypothetical protein
MGAWSLLAAEGCWSFLSWLVAVFLRANTLGVGKRCVMYKFMSAFCPGEGSLSTLPCRPNWISPERHGMSAPGNPGCKIQHGSYSHGAVGGDILLGRATYKWVVNLQRTSCKWQIISCQRAILFQRVPQRAKASRDGLFHDCRLNGSGLSSIYVHTTALTSSSPDPFQCPYTAATPPSPLPP